MDDRNATGERASKDGGELLCGSQFNLGRHTIYVAESFVIRKRRISAHAVNPMLPCRVRFVSIFTLREF